MQSETQKAMVLFSGGLDSTTLLALAIERFSVQNVQALSIFYGQKHDKEITCARDLAAHYGVPLHTLDLKAIFAGATSSLLQGSDEDIPAGTYADQQLEEGELVSTYVPFRNGLFLSSAASFALSHECSVLMYGAHADDAAGDAYPDCSPAFVQAMADAISLGTAGTCTLEAPFVSWRKADIVKEGLRLQVPYERTWSCYEGGDVPCGVCGTCLDRARAFELNGTRDPLITRS